MGSFKQPYVCAKWTLLQQWGKIEAICPPSNQSKSTIQSGTVGVRIYGGWIVDLMIFDCGMLALKRLKS